MYDDTVAREFTYLVIELADSSVEGGWPCGILIVGKGAQGDVALEVVGYEVDGPDGILYARPSVIRLLGNNGNALAIGGAGAAQRVSAVAAIGPR